MIFLSIVSCFYEIQRSKITRSPFVISSKISWLQRIIRAIDLFSGLEDVERERKRDIIDCGENKEPFFAYAWRRKNASSLKTRESPRISAADPLRLFTTQRRDLAYRLQCYHIKAIHSGEHMHAWPQDLIRAEGGRRGEGGDGVIGYIDNKTNRSHLVSIGIVKIRRWRAMMAFLIEIIQFSNCRKSMKRFSHPLSHQNLFLVRLLFLLFYLL